MKLNLGCGNKKLPGWVNCDYGDYYDRFIDLNDPDWAMWGLRASSADEVLMDQVLEHLSDTTAVMENIHRVLKPGGVATIRVPFAGSYAAWNDPTHRHHFTPETFRYFEVGHPSQHYVGVAFRKVEVRWLDDNSTWLARLRNRIPFRDQLRWLFWSMHDGIEARLTK